MKHVLVISKTYLVTFVILHLYFLSKVQFCLLFAASTGISNVTAVVQMV